MRWSPGLGRAIVLFVVLLLAVAACQAEPTQDAAEEPVADEPEAPEPDEPDEEEPDAEADGEPADDAALEDVGARLDDAMAPAAFTEPGEPFDMAENEGRVLWFIGVLMALPYVASVADGVEEAAERAGMDVVVFDGRGDVATFNEGVQQAISQGADVIHLQAIDPAVVSESIADAVAAGIHVIDAENRSFQLDPPENIFGHVTRDWILEGERLADYVVVENGGEPTTVALFLDPTFSVLGEMVDGFSDQLTAACPECQIHVENFDVAEMATEMSGQVQTTLRRDPDIEWIVMAFDGQLPFVAEALRAAGREDVRVIGSDAVLENLDAIRRGDIQEATIGVPPTWKGWATVDQAGRALLGLEPAGQSVPIRLFTAENLPAEGELDEEDVFGETDFRAAYQELWGIGDS